MWYWPVQSNSYPTFVGTGVYGNDRWFNGNMSDIRVWDVVRSQVEIQNNLHTSSFSSPNLIGHWGLDEGSGTTSFDKTSNNNDADIYGASWSNETPSTSSSGQTTYIVTGTDANGCVATDSVDVTVNSISITSFSTDVTCNGSADGNATAIPPSNNIPSALISFTNWGGNEPNNAGGEDYAHIRGIDGKWNDHTSTYTLPHLMEAESDLGTLPGYIYLGTYQGHYYYKSTSGATWSVSKATAENAGGYLAVFSDIAENNFVYNLSASSEGVWIGLYQDTTDPSYSEPSGGWKWIEINGQVGAYNYSWSDGQATATATGLSLIHI